MTDTTASSRLPSTNSVAGSAPGNDAETETTGKSTRGMAATGSER